MDDASYMRRALDLAQRADGSVAPRPPVGAVIVADGAIVGLGATEPKPGLHAERIALEAAGERARGATVYVTLEPCAHATTHGPCADALVAAGVARVVAATTDPHPEVDGRGFAKLREAGITVEVGTGEDEGRELIAPFARWVATGRPLVTLKLATTLDGKVAAPDGTSRWITGEDARREVHDMRRRADAVLVGAGTVETDDPALTFREPGIEGVQPLRVVLDSSGRTDPAAKMFDGDAPVLVVTSEEAPIGRYEAWKQAGADVVAVAASERGVDLEAALDVLGERGLCSVLCEGGPTLAGSLVAQGLVDRFVLYLAPKLIGGDAPGALGTGVKTLADAWELDVTDVRTVGADVRIDARPRTGIREGRR